MLHSPLIERSIRTVTRHSTLPSDPTLPELKSHIDDLMAMDQEMQCLHPNADNNGNKNSSPEPMEEVEEEEDAATTKDLLPGQSKKRRRMDMDLEGERFQLLGDSEEERDPHP